MGFLKIKPKFFIVSLESQTITKSYKNDHSLIKNKRRRIIIMKERIKKQHDDDSMKQVRIIRNKKTTLVDANVKIKNVRLYFKKIRTKKQVHRSK